MFVLPLVLTVISLGVLTYLTVKGGLDTRSRAESAAVDTQATKAGCHGSCATLPCSAGLTCVKVGSGKSCQNASCLKESIASRDCSCGIKRVFVTSTSYDGNLGGLAGADAKCQTRAAAANLGGAWKAWLSDGTASAASRLTHSRGPYVRLDGATVANNWADLTDGTIRNAIYLDEFGKDHPGEVWTNTYPNGEAIGYMNTKFGNCTNWMSNNYDYNGYDGFVGATYSGWTYFFNRFCVYEYSLYCFEQ